MTFERALLGIAIIMLMMVVSGPVASALRNVGVPLNP